MNIAKLPELLRKSRAGWPTRNRTRPGPVASISRTEGRVTAKTGSLKLCAGVDVELVTGAEADKLFTEMTQRLQMSGAQKQVEKPI